MRFKQQWIASSLVVLSSFSITSCGMMGTKNKPSMGGNVGANGCLDNSKDLVGRYVKGEMDQAEWKSSFDCINQSLEFFTEYVRGATDNSYTQGDMYNLISKFLITNGKVNQELMRGAFSLKAALFGGDSREFTKEQVELLKTALTRLQLITSDLIPYLKHRQDPNVTYSDLIKMVGAFKIAGEQIGDYINTLPVGDMSDQALNVLITQLTETLDLPVIDGLDRKVFLAKWMMFNTRRDVIEGKDWAQFFKTAMHVGGMALAFKTAQTIDNPENTPVMTRLGTDYRFREFAWELMNIVKPIIQDSLTKHEGNTPFPLFDHLIDEIPNDFLTDYDPTRFKEKAKETLRPFMRRMLHSGTQTGVDQGVIDTVYNVAENIVKDLGVLDRFYEKSGIDHYDVKSDAFKIALNQYQGGLSGENLTRFKAIKDIMLSYQPLFYKDSGYIMYDDNVGYTRFQNAWVVVGDRALNHLLRSYGSGSNYFLEEDLHAIYDDYIDLLYAFKFVDKTVSRFWAKRFQDIDLFTPVSDGNQQVTIPETMNYIMMIMSSAKLTVKMRDEITPRCDQNLGQDDMGWTKVPISCFRNEFHRKLSYWLTYMPRMKKYWDSLSAEEQEKGMLWLEHGSRRYGYNDMKHVDKYDFGSMATVLHYTEAMFTRFDTKRSEVEILNKAEVNNAFPVFKTLIQKKATALGGLANNNYVLKAVFSFIVKFKIMPGTGDISKLLLWMIKYKFTNYTADRVGIFNIVCQLAGPDGVAPGPETDALNRKVCSP